MAAPPTMHLADGTKESAPTPSPGQPLHPYPAGLPHVLPPGLCVAPPVSLEALVPSPSPPGGGGAELDETEWVQVHQSLTYPFTGR